MNSAAYMLQAGATRWWLHVLRIQVVRAVLFLRAAGSHVVATAAPASTSRDLVTSSSSTRRAP